MTGSLFQATTLEDAIARLGIVQADPIRSPAYAQDLILRQRVTGTEPADLEQGYPHLPLEEDHIHVYGFMSTSTLSLCTRVRGSGEWNRSTPGLSSIGY